MIYWAELNYVEKMKHWRDLRIEISSMPTHEAALTVAKFWALVPYSNNQLNLYDPDTWPSPWEILQSNSVCNNMISVMIYHTLKFAIPNIKIEANVINESGKDFLVVTIDKTYVLNYELGNLINKDTLGAQFIHTYTNIKTH